jgi:sugar O-acyltransferase (sialic acid O-acetyltransferase NeuD family)
MKSVLIIGAGGHGREVLDIFLSLRRHGSDLEVLGFIDEGVDAGSTMCGLPILGGFEWFEQFDRHNFGVVCAAGTPELSRRLVCSARMLGLRFVSAISPRALISPTAEIGKGVMIFPNVVVSCGVVVGSYSTLNVASTVSHDSHIGDYCSVSPGAHLAGNVSLGRGCFVGMGCNVIQGVSVGARSVIGAGAAVIDDVPAGVTVAGVPARIVRNNTSPTPLARHRTPRRSELPKPAEVDQ